MRKLSLKLFIVIFALGVTLVGCKKDDDDDYVKPDGQPDDTTIPIDDNSAFNMKNFIVSFDQMFTSNARWAWNFTHNYTDGKAITSFRNRKIYGKFGNNDQTVTHNYDSKGIITSSERLSKLDSEDLLTFEYEYDLEGYIIKHTKFYQGRRIDIVNFEYNSNGQLMKKSHEAIYMGDEVRTETFAYNSDGSVSVYEGSGESLKYEYSSGNMIEVKNYRDGVLKNVEKYEYDSEGRVTKKYGDSGTWYVKFEYDGSEIVTISRYEGDLLNYKEEFGVGLITIKSWNYNYRYDDSDVFMYCRAQEKDENGKTKKNRYYEGTPTNLQLVGYSIIDSRDAESTKKTKESIYNSSGNKLYYAEFTVVDGSITEKNWFNATGSSITTGDITESWVFVLVK